jgi:ATP-dependent exoDNAse (exonuclease V) beta subunit
MESIRKLNPNYEPKSEYELKQEILSENLRLLYVAITRAKNKLIITSSAKAKSKFGKDYKTTPSTIFDTLLVNNQEVPR